MSVLLQTSKGDIVVDVYAEETPIAAKNFLKLCKLKYYHGCLFHNVQQGFICQTGDPTGTGRGGESVYGRCYGEHARFFEDEIRDSLKHDRAGVVGMANAGENMNASQFYITTGKNCGSLDGKHTIFGEVSEGFDALERIDGAYVDDKGRPWQNIRIRRTYILDDPFEDPPSLGELIPEHSPEIPRDPEDDRLEDDWEPGQDERDPEEVEKETRRQEAHSRAVLLEMIGDIPDAEMKPPENMLFVCRLNPVTTEEDLEILFSRFGRVTSCDVIRDKKTGESLQYAFIGFEDKQMAESAYFKMDNVLVDDRRIKVDFSQSAYQLWRSYSRRGKRSGSKEDRDLAMAHAFSDRPRQAQMEGQAPDHSKGYSLVPEGESSSPPRKREGRSPSRKSTKPRPSGRSRSRSRSRSRRRRRSNSRR